MYYKLKYRNTPREQIPEFPIPQHQGETSGQAPTVAPPALELSRRPSSTRTTLAVPAALRLLMAANYLDM